MFEIITGILVLSAGVFALVAAVGILKLPDVLIRMHASTKVGTLSCGIMMVACAVHFADGPTIVRAVAIMIFILLTAPIAGHMIGRAVIETGVPLWKRDKEPTQSED